SLQPTRLTSCHRSWKSSVLCSVAHKAAITVMNWAIEPSTTVINNQKIENPTKPVSQDAAGLEPQVPPAPKARSHQCTPAVGLQIQSWIQKITGTAYSGPKIQMFVNTNSLLWLKSSN